LDFDTTFDPVLRAVVVVMAASLILTLVLLMAVAWLRWRQRANLLRARKVAALWRGAWMRLIVDEEAALPTVQRHHRSDYLWQWTHLAESLRGPSHDRLRRAIHATDLQSQAIAWLRRGTREQALLSLLALGHLGDRGAWPHVLDRLDDPHPQLGMAAARALLQIDAAQAAEPVARAIASNPEWPITRMALMLREAGPTDVLPALRDQLHRSEPAVQATLVRVLAAVDAISASLALEPLLVGDEHPERLAACLQHAQTPGALPRVRELLQHPLWWVRLHAAGALARLGMPSDKALLMPLLQDEQWWVRYRAADALRRLPGTTEQSLAALRDSLTAPAARAAVVQAMAERSWT
jgi:HEAT repeat protein